MAKTFRSGWKYVTNGDSTSHDTTSIGEDIDIISSQIRWQGVTDSNTTSSTSHETNSNYSEATATESTDVAHNWDQMGHGSTEVVEDNEKRSDLDSSSANTGFPVIPTPWNFTKHRLVFKITNTQSWEITTPGGSYEDFSETSNPFSSQTLAAYETKILHDETVTPSSAHTGTRSISLNENDSATNVQVELYTYGEYTPLHITEESDIYAPVFPSVPDGYDFDYHRLNYQADNLDPTDRVIDVEYEDIDGNSQSKHDVTVPADTASHWYYDSSSSQNRVGEKTHTTAEVPPDYGEMDVSIDTNAYTYGKDVTVNSDTATAEYPSVPNGYDFDHHYWEKSDGTSGYVYSKNVGGTVSITSNDPNNTVWVKCETVGEDTTYNTTYYHTNDPSVSGDVSGSYTGQLSDNEYSSWQNLSGMSEGTNTFNHSISESNEAYFQFEYTYEYEYPDRVGKLRKYNDVTNSTVDLPLVNPSDSLLEYDVLHIYNHNTGEIHAFDVVDISDPGASDLHFYHPTHGLLAVQEYNP